MQYIYFKEFYFIHKRFLKILIWDQCWRTFKKKQKTKNTAKPSSTVADIFDIIK